MFQNVQPNWNESDNTKDSYILNKPTITEPVQVDWDESDSSELSYILNKPTISDTNDYLCFTALESNSTVAMATYNNIATTYKPTVEYSTDKVTWHTLITNATPASPVTLANVGDRMWVRGDNAHFSANNTDYTKFVLTGKVNVSGNIMSLLDKTCKQITLPTASEDLQSYVFASLFYNNSAWIDASELELPAMTMVYGCYYSMFRSCSNLVNAPKLPATTLATYCYGGMFRDCTSLVEAPELPATTVTNYSYSALFRGCTSLKHIKYPLGDFTACNSWMQDASATGVFECRSVLDTSTRGTSTVPAGWTIVRTDAPWSDWTQTDSTEASYIKNKPTIPDPQVQADWDESDSSEVSFILNKPVIPVVPANLQKYVMTDDATSSSTVEVSPSGDIVKHITVASALTLSATSATGIAYAEIVLDIGEGATVTAGTGITLVDTPEAGKSNVCVIRWSGGTAKLYVVITEDLPQA